MLDHIVTISAQIPSHLDQDLTRICKLEERSKSYFIKKALENFLKEKSEELARLAKQNPSNEAINNFSRIFARKISDKNFANKSETEITTSVRKEIKAARKTKTKKSKK